MTPGVQTKKLGRSMSRLSSDGRWRGPDQKSPGHAWATGQVLHTLRGILHVPTHTWACDTRASIPHSLLHV